MRDGIIAGGAALCLLPENWTDFTPDELGKGVSASLKKLRAKLSTLNEQGLDTTPEKRLANEKKMLEIGIPGDAFLKQPWSDNVTATSISKPKSSSGKDEKAEKSEKSTKSEKSKKVEEDDEEDEDDEEEDDE